MKSDRLIGVYSDVSKKLAASVFRTFVESTFMQSVAASAREPTHRLTDWVEIRCEGELAGTDCKRATGLSTDPFPSVVSTLFIPHLPHTVLKIQLSVCCTH